MLDATERYPPDAFIFLAPNYRQQNKLIPMQEYFQRHKYFEDFMQKALNNGAFQIFLTALLFYVAGKLTLPLSLPPSYATAIWPPAGIGLAATLLWGYKVLPGIFVGEFLIHYELYDSSTLWSNPTELLIFLLNPANSSMRAWLGSFLARKLGNFPNDLISARLIGLFFLLAGPIATSIPALLSVSGLLYNGVIHKDDFLYAFFIWWLGDCIGIAVFTPLFFIVFNRSSRIWRERTTSLGLPLILMFLITAFAYLYAHEYETRRLQKLVEYRSIHFSQALEKHFNRQLKILGVYQDFTHLLTVNESIFRQVTLSIFDQLPNTSYLMWLEPADQGNDQRLIKRFGVNGNGRQSHEFEFAAQHLTGKGLGNGIEVQTGQKDFLVTLPIFDDGLNGCHCLKGVVAGIFDLNRFIRGTIADSNLDHLVVDMFKDRAHNAEAPFFQSHNEHNRSDPLHLNKIRPVALGQSHWLLQLTPDKQFLGDNYSWTVWQLLAGGMFLTSFASFSLLLLTGHTESVRSEVDRHTEELKHINCKLAASEQQFRKLVHTQSAIVWRADPETMRFLFVNDEAESLLGYPVQQWLEDPDFCQKHIHPADFQRAQAFCASETARQNCHEIEFRMVASDGRVVWLRNFVDLSIENGLVVELYGFMIDITRQKQAEEQLRLAATTFESQQGIMITDSDAKILSVNKAFTEITGYSQEAIEGLNPSILQSGRHDDEFYRQFWEELKTNGRFEGEMWNRRRNGEIYPQWQTITAVRNEMGHVTHYVAMCADITEKKNAESKIHALAYYDPLTNLPNRRLLLDRFEQELTVAQRHKKFGAVIFLDLDHFKVLNDTQGHLIGDELLIQVADRLSSVLRKQDTPARLGGDEFVVLLHAESDSLSVAAEHTRVVAEKIREKLNEPFLLHHYLHRLSPSIGIALFPDNHENPDKILQQADIAMYRSKASGRNTVSFFHPTMQEATDARLNLEQHLRTAVAEGNFLLYYQPQVNNGHHVFGAEALLRWQHPTLGLLEPNEFISVAEDSSIILDIGLWVLTEACRQIKAWCDAGVASPHVSVNISAHQFRQKNFVGQLQSAVRNSGIDANLLGIELTESLMITDIEDTIIKMKALKDMGVAIAIDDFGTGYSSLIYLKRLPIDVLKIDRGFVTDILQNANDAVIIETIIGMAHNLNLRVIAEGVETIHQLDFLKRRGCHAFQGYYFGRPVPADTFAERYFRHTLV